MLSVFLQSLEPLQNSSKWNDLMHKLQYVYTPEQKTNLSDYGMNSDGFLKWDFFKMLEKQ